LQTYEFLHATFGEFLVARLIVRILTDLVAREAAATLPLRPRPPMTPCCTRCCRSPR
jgi:hypothetical protein